MTGIRAAVRLSPPVLNIDVLCERAYQFIERGPISASELRERMNVHLTNAERAADRLVSRGWVVFVFERARGDLWRKRYSVARTKAK